jgi:hypothetical protein
VNASYITEVSVEQTADACRKLLLAKGWQPYGMAGDVLFFKQNAVRLAARISTAPAQGGKTVIDYSTELMSVDLPAPADTVGLQYTDVNTQLFFDAKTSEQDIVGFYRPTLAKAGWEATTEKPRSSGKSRLNLSGGRVVAKTVCQRRLERGSGRLRRHGWLDLIQKGEPEPFRELLGYRISPRRGHNPSH